MRYSGIYLHYEGTTSGCDVFQQPRESVFDTTSGSLRYMDSLSRVYYFYNSSNINGTSGYLARFNSINTLVNSIISELSGFIGIGLATPGKALDVSGAIRSNDQLISTIASGTSPLSVLSATLVSNLNSDLLDGQHASAFDASGTGHSEATAHVSGHEGTYNHANYNTAYGWGNHSGLYLPILGTAVDSDKLDGQHGSYYAVAGAAPAEHRLNGDRHIVSDLVSGYFLKATGATTFGFVEHGLTYSDVNAASSDHGHAQLHDRSHALDSTSDHTSGSLTDRYVTYFATDKLANSPITTDGTRVGIRVGTSPSFALDIAPVSGDEVALRISTGEDGWSEYPAGIYLRHTGIAHGRTDLYPTDVFGVLEGTAGYPKDGGLRVVGLSDSAWRSTDTSALSLVGIFGESSPNSGCPAVCIMGQKGNGASGVTYLGDDDTVVAFDNYGDRLLSIKGDGDIYTKDWTSYAGFATYSGWSGSPTGVYWYKKIGKTMHIKLNIGGVSNNTIARISVPFPMYVPNSSASDVSKPVVIIDNGTVQTTPGYAFAYDANTLGFAKDWASTVFTESGNKTIIMDTSIELA